MVLYDPIAIAPGAETTDDIDERLWLKPPSGAGRDSDRITQTRWFFMIPSRSLRVLIPRTVN